MSDNEEQVSAESADGEDAGTDAEPTEETRTEREGGEETGPESETAPDATGDKALLDRVRETDEDLADAVEARLTALGEERDDLRARLEEREAEIEDLESTVDDLESRIKRTQADFQNYKKRAKKRQEQLQERATEDLVARLVDVRDNLVRALEADHENVASIREGVEMTLREFDRLLDGENVAEIDPEPGTAVDPQRHEVMMRVDSDQPADAVAEVYRPGYEMGGKVIRAAQVTVSEGADEEGSDDESVRGSETADANGDDGTGE